MKRKTPHPPLTRTCSAIRSCFIDVPQGTITCIAVPDTYNPTMLLSYTLTVKRVIALDRFWRTVQDFSAGERLTLSKREVIHVGIFGLLLCLAARAWLLCLSFRPAKKQTKGKSTLEEIIFPLSTLSTQLVLNPSATSSRVHRSNEDVNADLCPPSTPVLVIRDNRLLKSPPRSPLTRYGKETPPEWFILYFKRAHRFDVSFRHDQNMSWCHRVTTRKAITCSSLKTMSPGNFVETILQKIHEAVIFDLILE